MHELSLASAVVDTVERHAAGRRVTLVSLRVGALRQVVPDSLEFYFGFVAQGTVCEGARLEYSIVEAEFRCSACAYEWTLEQPAFRCPACASGGAEVLGGDELEVESIEIQEEDACIASG